MNKLRRSPLWHIALERDPEREARELFFAGGGHHEAEHGGAESHDEHSAHGEKHAGVPVDPMRQRLIDAMQQTPWGGKLLALDEKANSIGNTYAHVLGIMQLPDVVKNITEAGGLQHWNEQLAYLRTESEMVEGWRTIIGDITEFGVHSFGGHASPPDRFIDSIRSLALKTMKPEEANEYLLAMSAVEARHAHALAEWEHLTPQQRNEVITDFWKTGKVDKIIDKVEEEMGMREEAVKEHKKLVEEMQATKGKQHDEEAAMHGNEEGGLANFLGIRFYRITDIISAFQQIKAAYEHSFHEQVRLAGGRLAKTLSPIIEWGPYGHDVAHHIDEEFENQNTKVSNEEKERLTRENLSFRALFFGEHGHEAVLTSYMHQGLMPKARGVVEYAASRGWLYDIDEISMEDPIIGKFKLRSIVPGDWSDDRVGAYFTRLRGMNRSGLKEEREKVKNRENKDSFDLFLAATQKEFDKVNLWGALGVMERAIERGLSDVTITRLAVEFMRRLREDPLVRQYASKCREFIDQAGMLSMYRTCPTLGWLKMERRNIQEWLKRDGKDLADSGTLGKTMMLIEQELEERIGDTLPHNPKERKQKIDELIGLILTGQRVVLKDGKGKSQTFTLFSARYDFYTNLEKNNYFRNQGAAKPHDEDIDYYIGNTDQILGPPGNVNGMWNYGSTREFDNETNAKLLGNKIIAQATEYANAGEDVLFQSFAKGMRSRLDSYAENRLVKERGGTILKLLAVKIETAYKKGKKTSAPMFAALIANGLISPSVFFNEKDRGTDVAKTLEEQLKAAPFSFSQGEIDVMKSEGINPRCGF